MLYVELNDGRTENLMHISEINIDGSDIVYKSARGSLAEYREHFDDETSAQLRYTELQKDLLV